jgi:hypothetical protein
VNGELRIVKWERQKALKRTDGVQDKIHPLPVRAELMTDFE